MWTPVPLLCILIKYFCAWLRIWRASERASEHMGRLHGAARRYAVLHTRLRRYLDDGLGADEGFDLLPVAIVSVAAITVSKRSARTSSSDVSM